MRILLLALPLLAASCNREDQPRSPTSEESDRLNEVDAMLDELAKEEGPEANAPGPSNRSE